MPDELEDRLANDTEPEEKSGELPGPHKADVLARKLSLGKELGFDELREVYRFANKSDYRVLAGKQLGYSDTRIWINENEISVGIPVIAVAAPVSFGIGYVLGQYLF